MEEVKLSGKSKNIISENIFKMMKIFPEVVVDNKIDCGRKHFETIAPNVKFIITDHYKNFVKNL